MSQEMELQIKIKNYLINNLTSFIITKVGDDYVTPTLQALVDICDKDKGLKRVLVIASKKNIQQEWLTALRQNSDEDTLSYVTALGKKKRKCAAFLSDRKIILTNDEELSWIEDVQIKSRYILIIDELSRYRHCSTERYEIIRKIAQKASRVAAYSRLPIPHGLEEIWEEIFLLDEGRRLGKKKEAFLDRYFFVNRIWMDGYVKHYITPKKNAAEAISKAIRDICFDASKIKENHSNSQKRRNVYVDLSRSEMSRYRMMAHEFLIEFDEKHSLSVNDTSMVAGKLLQLASGTVYCNDKEVIGFHERKIEALRQLIEEYKGQNILVAYWFKHELIHVQQSLPWAKEISSPEDIDEWNNGKIKIGLINSSMKGMPGDLSKGGSIIVWFSPTWSLALYSRTNQRVLNNDIRSTVIHLIARETIDETVLKMLGSNRKDNTILVNAIRGNQQ